MPLQFQGDPWVLVRCAEARGHNGPSSGSYGVQSEGGTNAGCLHGLIHPFLWPIHPSGPGLVSSNPLHTVSSAGAQKRAGLLQGAGRSRRTGSGFKGGGLAAPAQLGSVGHRCRAAGPFRLCLLCISTSSVPSSQLKEAIKLPLWASMLACLPASCLPHSPSSPFRSGLPASMEASPPLGRAGGGDPSLPQHQRSLLPWAFHLPANMSRFSHLNQAQSDLWASCLPTHLGPLPHFSAHLDSKTPPQLSSCWHQPSSPTFHKPLPLPLRVFSSPLALCDHTSGQL